MSQILIKDLIDQFIEIQSGTPWLDETFDKKLLKVDDINAFTRPLPDVHSIAEILSHLVVWRFEILSRLEGNERKLWADRAENWLSNEELEKNGWNDLIRRFDQSQDKLIGFLQSKDDTFLEITYKDKNFKYLVEGLLHHDLYHLGQIGLVNKLLKSTSESL